MMTVADSSTSPASFSTTILVDATPAEAFAAINDVRSWWTGTITGETDRLGGEFTYRYEDFHYSKQRIVELVPGKTIAWLVVDSALNSFADPREWNGTTITFEIAREGDRTSVRFSHLGLLPEVACYGACSRAWTMYMKERLARRIERRPA